MQTYRELCEERLTKRDEIEDYIDNTVIRELYHGSLLKLIDTKAKYDGYLAFVTEKIVENTRKQPMLGFFLQTSLLEKIVEKKEIEVKPLVKMVLNSTIPQGVIPNLNNLSKHQ